MQPKIFFKYFISFFLVSVSQFLAAQQKEDNKSIFVEAESYFLFEEYNEAVGLYQKLIKEMPENANINYKLGRCYLHDPYKKELAIPYLKKATVQISDNYKEKSFKEVNAPREALYYLGDAYRVTNQLDKAIETYKKFLQSIDEDIYDKSLVEDQINACNIAKEQMENPVYSEAQNLGKVINAHTEQINPVISGKGDQLAFVSKLPFYDAIFYTEKVNGQWKEPRNLTPELQVDGQTYPTSLSYDGKEMYLYRTDQYNGNLYVTLLENNKWTKPVKLNDNINTKYWESHASISKDKQTLYFTSNRPGGFGDLDIYKAKRISGFEWGEPENLGSTVNSRYNDDTPFITPDGLKLYFASLGHKNMGGYDIFISNLENGKWTEPKNIGYPVNTTSDELFFMPYKDGNQGYMSLFKEDGFGLTDLYQIEIFSEKNPRKFRLVGKLQDAVRFISGKDKLLVEVFSSSGNEKISETIINDDGTFELLGQSGDITLKISGKDIKDYIHELSIPIGHESDTFNVGPKLERARSITKKVSEDETKEPLLELDIDYIELTKNEPVEIKFKSDRNINVEIKAVNNNKVYFEDNFTTKRKRNTIKIEPQPGRSVVSLKITDNKGNDIQKEVMVVYVPEENNIVSDKKDETEKVEKKGDDFEIILNDLISISEGEVRNSLKKVKIREDITTLKDLLNRLLEESKKGLFTVDEVDKLLKKYANHLACNFQIKKVNKISGEELSASLDQILKNSPDVTSASDLLKKYFDVSAGFDQENLVPVLVNLATLTTKDFKELTMVLSAVLGKNQLKIAQNYDTESYNESNLSSYFNKVILNGQNGSDAGDIYLELLEKLLLKDYIKNLHTESTGNLANILYELVRKRNEPENNQSLINYLFEQSVNKDYSKDEVISLFYELNKSIEKERLVDINDVEQVIGEKAEEGNKQAYYWLAGGALVFLVWLLIMVWRKKKKH